MQALCRGLGDWRSDGGFATRLTVVTGPAGFGKTTLVADWLASVRQEDPDLSIGWLALEPVHDDPAHFGAALLAAVSSVYDGAPPDGSDHAQGLSLSQSLTLAMSAIDRAATPSILVLDDYHLINHPPIHEALNDLVSHLKPSMHLVLIGRADPPLPLSRLRAQRALSEIRARDLRFTTPEATEFLRDIMGLDLSPDDITILERRTEGWVTGLQLAAHSLQSEGDRAGFLTAFAGDDRFVADYLMEEVLLRQPPDVQRFLLRTAILDRLEPDLCDAVTGRDDSRSILTNLDHANLFVVPLDARRHAYRYHRLFADLLAVRLKDSGEDEHDLHRRAARWYEVHEAPKEAILHALAGGDLSYAADLVTRAAPQRFLVNELPLLARWVDALPDGELLARPRLCLGAAWANLATGQPDAASRYVELLEQALGHNVQDLCLGKPLPPEQAAALVEGAAVLSRIQIAWLDAPGALSLCDCALALVASLPYEPEDPPEATLRGDHAAWPPYFNRPSAVVPVLLFNQGLAQKFDNQIAAASRSLSASANMAQALGNAHLVALALGHLAHVERIQGRLALSSSTIERGLRLLERLSNDLSPLAGMLIAHQGSIAFAHNDTEQAERLWRKAIGLARAWENWEALLPAYLGLARLSRVRGDWLSAHDALDTLLELTVDQTDICQPIIDAYRAWFLAEAGESHAALHWAESVPEASRKNWAYLLHQENLCRARVLLAIGDHAGAAALAARLSAEAATAESWGRWLEVEVVHAQALNALGRPEATAVLESALARAGDEVILQPFVEAGPVLRPLLLQARSSARAANMARLVLQALPSADQQPDSGLIDLGPEGGLLESLTDRESEVLQLIASGLSNREIADTLFLTEGTVKNHAHSIYGKLDANGRTHAVARARALGLLDATP